jgi:hypothetical protein
MSEFYTQVMNIKWANAEHTAIDCEVNFNHLPDEFVPFTANPTDVMEYSKTIFDECVAGQYGEIAEYVAPPVIEQPQTTKEELQMQISALQAQLDELK